jgi:tRNA-specific 2-thiouridylase
VVDKDLSRNALILGTQEELDCSELTVRQVNWVSGKAPASPINCRVKIRYRAREIPGTVYPEAGNSIVILDEPARGVTPGQAAVFYDGEVCLGGGVILTGTFNHSGRQTCVEDLL